MYIKYHITEILVLSVNNLVLHPNIPLFSKSSFKTINFGSKIQWENLALMINNEYKHCISISTIGP